MIDRNNPLIREAASLPPLDKLQLVDYLLESLDMPDTEIEKLWAEESSHRWEGYKAGEISSVSAAMNIRFLEPAQNELDDAFDWYGMEQSGLGHRFLTEIQSALKRITVFPGESTTNLTTSIKHFASLNRAPGPTWTDATKRLGTEL